MDLWRKIFSKVMRRGGLCADGPNQLDAVWQPSQTQAHDNETTEQKHLRRGNNAADHFANKGRQLYSDVTDLITTTKARFGAIKHWVAWVGKASQLQHSSEVAGSDHDMKEGRKSNHKGPMQGVHIPTEARVIRRMPWASNSLGTKEYNEDLWVQDAMRVAGDDQVVKQASGLQSRISKEGSVAEKFYVEF